MVQRPRRPAPKKLGAKLRQIRISLDLSQSELVGRLNYEASPLYPAQISNFEHGKREPPIMLILAYARLVGVQMEVLVDDALELRIGGSE
jgi:transcriptional regulator with XRE-family HTH domain